MPTIASRAELEALLLDDVPYGDLTTDALGIGAAPGTMQFTARDAMALALAEDAAAIIEFAGGRVELHASSGSVLERGSPILTAHTPFSVAAIRTCPSGLPTIEKPMRMPAPPRR